VDDIVILDCKGPGYYKLPEIVLMSPFGKILARKKYKKISAHDLSKILSMGFIIFSFE